MKRNHIIMLVLAGSILMHAHACTDQMSNYSAGVVFSKGEMITTENVELYCPDSLSYIKKCDVAAGEVGQPFKLGSVEGKPLDPLNIDSVWVSGNTLNITVQYGGGCRVHTIELFTDGKTTVSIPGMIDLRLTHNANGDNCKALVRETLVFNLTGLCECSNIQLNIYAPGTKERFPTAPLWTPISGLKTRFCSYKIRSAYSEKVMAYIGAYIGFASTISTNFKQVLVIFDSTLGVPSAADKTAAVKAELERLKQMNVLTVSDVMLSSIETKLSASPALYWTAEDTVLQFNQWFDGDGVNAVKSVYSTRGCGSGVAYELPVKPISVSTMVPQHRSAVKSEALKVFMCQAGGEAQFAPAGENTRIVVTDIVGKVIMNRSIPRGQNHSALHPGNKKFLRGCFLVSIVDNGRTRVSKTVTILR